MFNLCSFLAEVRLGSPIKGLVKRKNTSPVEKMSLFFPLSPTPVPLGLRLFALIELCTYWQNLMAPGKYPQRVRPRSLLCYCVVKEPAISGPTVAKRIGITQPAAGKAVRGKKNSLG